MKKPNFIKMDKLVPAIIQDNRTGKVLMLGYMNEEAWEMTNQTGLVTFYSRSKQRLWTKGEESGHVLKLNTVYLDCDQDAILIKATPNGPVCHTGADTCWEEDNKPNALQLEHLESVIRDRMVNMDESSSYTASLFKKGLNKIAQKVGEEAVELIIEAKDDNDDLFKNECADLLYHLMVLLASKNISFSEVMDVLQKRAS